ncbi:hypothetical protein Q4599_00855 [Cellulophaga lytica]|uniref:hypothetical protein n=1 Tax=Cellulophaga lytica TaxID=979 RepID=UPI0026E3F65F|nr:hypothetical protein [Cellulophaga lytica]MDO6852110.1 hypothetical protein [Cellulophaga lytica]
MKEEISTGIEKNKSEPSNVVKTLMLENERNVFSMKLIFRLIGYLLITILLNSIRQTSSLYIVWTLIIIQFLLYFSIFILCFNRSKVFGLNKNIAFIIFVLLAFLGRVESLEIIIFPLMAIIMLFLSYKNKKLSPAAEYHLLNNSKKVE